MAAGPRSAMRGPWPSGRFLTTSMVTATVLAAGVGYLLNDTASKSAQAAGIAQQYSLQAAGAIRAADESAYSDYFTYLVQQSEQAAAAVSQWNSGIAGLDQQRWSAQAAAHQGAADQSAAQIASGLAPDSATGPLLDPGFPNAYFTAQSQGAVALQSQAYAENGVSTLWGNLTGSYSAVLALFAVALFLFGSALGLAGRNRASFGVLGIVLVLSGAAWAGGVAASAPQSPSTAAATDFSRGVQAFSTARTADALQPAIDDFTAAIAKLPDFARAYEFRADAERLRGGLQPGLFVGPTQQPWLDRQISDDQQAYALGVRDVDVIYYLSRALFSRWLLQPSAAPPDDVRALDAQLAQLDPENPAVWFDLGRYQLVSGQTQAAGASYVAGMSRALFLDAAATVARPPAQAFLTANWLATAVTDLDNVAGTTLGTRPGVMDAIQNLKGTLTASLAVGSVVQPDPGLALPPVPDGDAKLFVGPNALELEMTPPQGWDPGQGGQSLTNTYGASILWYERPLSSDGSGSGPWTVIPDAVEWGKAGAGASPLRYDSAGDRYFVEAQALRTSGPCMPNGQYRLDVSLNGHILVSATTPPVTDNAALVVKAQAGLGLATCVPDTWTNQTPVAQLQGQGALPLNGMSSTLVSPDGSEGAVVVRLDGYARITDSTVRNSEIMTQLIPFFTGTDSKPQLPADLTPAPGGQSSRYFAFLRNSVATEYVSASQGVDVFAGAGSTPNGDVVVGFVFGPASEWTDSRSLLTQVYRSFGSFGPL